MGTIPKYHPVCIRCRWGSLRVVVKAGPFCWSGFVFRKPNSLPAIQQGLQAAFAIACIEVAACRKVLPARLILPKSATTPFEDSTGGSAFPQTHRLSLQSVQPEVSLGLHTSRVTTCVAAIKRSISQLADSRLLIVYQPPSNQTKLAAPQ
jgi:hypothetical protein